MSEIEKNETEKKPDTLCVLCARSCVNQCCWCDEQKPVPGWVAEKNTRGYLVLDCPEYVKDTYETIKPQKLDDRGVMFLLEAFSKQLREDYVTGRGGPFDSYNANRKRETRKSPGEIRGLNRKEIEKWLQGPVAGKMLQFSNTDEVIDGLRKMARTYETELRQWMR